MLVFCKLGDEIFFSGTLWNERPKKVIVLYAKKSI